MELCACLLPKNIRVLGGGLVDDPVTVAERCTSLINRQEP